MKINYLRFQKIITPFVLAFTSALLFLLLGLSLTFAQEDNKKQNNKIEKINLLNEKMSIRTRMAKPNSFSQKEKRERLFTERTSVQGVTISVLKDEDFDQSNSAQSDSIDEAQFYIHIANNTKKNLPLLQIQTGIKEGTLNYIRVEGATGYFWKNGELVLAYLSLLPNASTTVTVTGLPIISSDSVFLDITPTVQDFDSHIISKGGVTRKLIGGKRFSLTDRFKMSGAKTEAPIASEPTPQ